MMKQDHHILDQIVSPMRIAVLSGYMTYYEPHMPPDFRAERTAWGQTITALFEPIGTARFFGLMTDLETGQSAAAALAEWSPDVVVLAPAMPGPPAFTWAAIESLERTPIVMWSAGHLDTLPPSYNSVDHLANSGGVGMAMIGNLLARHGRRPHVVTGRWYDGVVQDEVRSAVHTAAVAGRLRRARVGVLGKPLDGYANVIASQAELETLGATLVDIGLDEWEQTFASIGSDAIRAVGDALTRGLDVIGEATQDFEGSCRLAAALEAIAVRHELSCGTYNSHLEYGHRNPAIGLVGGLGTSWMTSRGIPFTDTGDTITALAMSLGRMLTGNAVYTELNTIDYAANAILCSNTGEADFSAGAARTLPASNFTGKEQRGMIVDATLRTGPATIIGLTPKSGAEGGLALIAFPGEVVGRPDLDLKVPHTLFRQLSQDASTGFSRWIEAGATHHAALCVGANVSEAVQTVARHIGIGCEVVQ